ncbi:hypothetical protein CVT24_004168 [Panaeolus cyanescens]|uniref:Uncharacterized protein n=1 Tax=Panaeolus cyanescens TaxID=181874 RepID=A0A409YX42_9AGAR|nr:hypothetical protein CVT24_004168 [Panaeolus cyanescens]
MQGDAKSTAVTDSEGLAYTCDGHLIYTPNTKRLVKIPPDIGEYEYRFDRKHADYERFTKPQWWNRPYGWTSFVPIKPIFDGPFTCLRNVDVEQVRNKEGRIVGYAIPKEHARQWLAVEHTIYRITSILKSKYIIRPALPPMPTYYLNPCKVHSTKSAANHHAHRCRNWVGMWIAFLSFNLAHCMDTGNSQYGSDTQQVVENEQWVIHLMNNGIPQSFVHDLRTSKHVKHPSSIERAGAFVNLFGSSPGRLTVEWLIKNRIPIWYRWTEAAETATRQNKMLDALIPKAGVLDTPLEFTAEGEEDLKHSTGYANEKEENSVIRRKRMSVIASKPWEAFFNHRKTLEAARIKRETSKSRHERFEREMNPPTGKHNYWHWRFLDSDTTKLMRVKLKSPDDPAIVGRPANQMIYYAWDDEWDICTHFGDDERPNDSFDVEDDENLHDNTMSTAEVEDTPAEPGEEKGMHTAYIEIFSKPKITHNKDEETEPAEQEDVDFSRTQHGYIKLESFDFNWILETYYGFVLPKQPLDSGSLQPRITVESWNKALQTMGRTKETKIQDMREGSAGAAVEFIRYLSEERTPDDNIFDLGANTNINIPPNDLRRYFIRLAKDLFVVRNSLFSDLSDDTWVLALRRPADVIYIYRIFLKCEDNGKREDVMQILIMDGIPFLTLKETSSEGMRCSLSGVTSVIPMQLSNHTYTSRDYANYIHRRAQILYGPRGRAALLVGGIVTRIAMEHLGTQGAIYGPSKAVTEDGVGINIYAAQRHFVDDGLTEDEMDIICGLEIVYTGKLGQLYAIQ